MVDSWGVSRETPGFIDAHSHLRSTSYAEHGVGGATLEEALLRMTAMSVVDTADDVFVACSELIAKGVTGVQMMFHTFGDPSDYLSVLEATVEGIRRSGIRAIVVLGTTDQAEFVPLGIDHNSLLPDFAVPTRRLTPTEFGEVVRQSVARYPDITFGVGPVGPQWCSDTLLHTIGDICQEGYRVHSHWAESVRQRSWAGPLFDRMNRAQLLGPHTSLAHAVWLTTTEMRGLADLGVSLVTCPLSNHLLNAGVADVAGWQAEGISVAVGLDSADREATPMAVAQRALSPLDAHVALTVGGCQATGIDSSDDRVVWSDSDPECPHSVTIGGAERVVDGHLVNGAEVAEARKKIADALAADASNREARHRILTALMPRYHDSIAAVSHES